MVTVVVEEGKVVLAGVAAVCRSLAVSLVEQELVYPPVPHREDAAQEVVRGVRAQDLRRGKLPGAADGYSDVRNRRQVGYPELLTSRAVDVPGHAAVGELDAHGMVVHVVVNPAYPAPGVTHEGARAVVGERVLLTGHPAEVIPNRNARKDMNKQFFIYNRFFDVVSPGITAFSFMVSARAVMCFQVQSFLF